MTRPRARRAALVLLAAWPLASLPACDRSGATKRGPSPEATGGSRDAGTATTSVSGGPAGLVELAGVVDPWHWPRARGATTDERAVEDIGPYEPADRQRADSPLVNTNAHYWTELVGIAWERDVDIDFDQEPVDLDGDGAADTSLTRHIHAKGGILANPDLFGLTPTPADPRGKVGRISASTGVLGLREALTPDGQRSGHVGMTCWICHGSANPTDGAISLGLGARNFDYGLLLATSALLDENNLPVAKYRRERGFTAGRAVQARLLLAGPGRQDLVNEFGLDLTVAGFHAGIYPQMSHARGKPHGVFNPVSVPHALATPGLMLQNWVGSEDSTMPALERLLSLARAPAEQVLADFGLPATDRIAARRALLTDLRNLGTLSLQQDSYPGLLWSDAVYGKPTLAPDILAAIPPMYSAQPLRQTLARTAAALARPAGNAGRIARGRAVFADKIVGEVANLQVLPHAPEAYASASLRGFVLAPLDPFRPPTAKVAVRCADCHNASPLERVVPFSGNPPPLGRCTHCHVVHPLLKNSPAAGESSQPAGESTDDQGLVPLAALGLPTEARAEVALCQNCHDDHRDFGPLVYSSSRLLPFDANLNGRAQGDEIADAAAGGIGTDPSIQVEVPPAVKRSSLHLPLIRFLNRFGPADLVEIGVMWIRVPPLTAVYASAPYLHNGSVPTLQALLQPAAKRPKTFALGRTGFVMDTGLPGNHNGGHEFGVRLSPSEKEDLIAFLRSL